MRKRFHANKGFGARSLCLSKTASVIHQASVNLGWYRRPLKPVTWDENPYTVKREGHSMKKRFHANRGFGDARMLTPDLNEHCYDKIRTSDLAEVQFAGTMPDVDITVEFDNHDSMTPEEMLAVHREVCGLKDVDLKLKEDVKHYQFMRQMLKIHAGIARYNRCMKPEPDPVCAEYLKHLNQEALNEIVSTSALT